MLQRLARMVKGAAILAVIFMVACSGGSAIKNALPNLSSERVPESAVENAAATSTLTGHLYVAGFISGCTGCPKDVVERYRFVNGVPVGPADLVYTHPFAEWHRIAIAPAYPHDLYESASQNGSVIFTYAPGNTTPLRTLNLPWRVMAIALDPQGHLFVGVVAFSGATAYRIVLVYPAGASGNAGYSSAFIVATCSKGWICPGTQGYSMGLVIDAQGELIVSVPGLTTQTPCAALCVYASPVTNPHIVHTISGSGVSAPLGLTVDDKNELYVGNPAFVSAFHRTLTGGWVLDREISIKGVSQIEPFGLAAGLGRLFVPVDVGTTPALYDVNSLLAGTQSPIVLHAPNPEDAKIGP